MSRADELSIICSATPGLELTPLHDATKIIKELEGECDAHNKRIRAFEGDHAENHT